MLKIKKIFKNLFCIINKISTEIYDKNYHSLFNHITLSLPNK